jgi:outer membrane protein OmpA-like peptidoglycan-associated protein
MIVKTSGKVVIGLLVLGVLGVGANHLMSAGYFNQKTVVASSVPPSINVGGGQATQNLGSSSVNLAPAANGGKMKLLEMAWNTQMGLNYSNGGATTQRGSLMNKHGVDLVIERQDDYSQMATQQIAFAKNPNEGAAFVIIMGDGYPAYVAGLQETLGKMGQQIEIIGHVGYSRGEDKCMMSPAVKSNPQLARGKTVAAVLRDGDWNICVKWASDNGIPINPDEKTYDSDALNFIASDDYVKAGNAYITGYVESRPEVKNGKKTGNVVTVTTDGVATWTPVDVTIAQKKGGIIAVASTKEYLWQMPAVVIGNVQWDAAHRDLVDNFLAAAFEGGEAVRSNDAALTAGADASAEIYKEESGAYWKKYFIGTTERDASGLNVSLGGSTTSGLGDNANLFGLKGNDNLYKTVYTVYGNIASHYYPDILPKLVNYATVVNTTYIADLLAKSSSVAAADKPTYSENAPTSGTFAQKAVHIEFASGSARFSGNAVGVLNDVANQLAISGNQIQINGHTDNVGNSNSNLTLSKQRAEAVKAFLVANAPSNFPSARIRTRGFGDTQPVVSNASRSGQAQNRRVDIILLSN